MLFELDDPIELVYSAERMRSVSQKADRRFDFELAAVARILVPTPDEWLAGAIDDAWFERRAGVVYDVIDELG